MHPLQQALAPWHDFYALLGAAAATLIGLLFVSASVSSGVFTQSRPGALRMFLSASVVQFSSILAGCLLVLAPLAHWAVLGTAILGFGGFGLVYSAMAWRDTVRDGIVTYLDLEDRMWYAVAPAVGYLVETIAGTALLLGFEVGCPVLAVAMGAMLLVAIHNAWDITVWTVTRRKN